MQAISNQRGKPVKPGQRQVSKRLLTKLPDTKGSAPAPSAPLYGPEQNECPFLSLMGEESEDCTLWGCRSPVIKRPENPAFWRFCSLIFPEDRVFLQIVDVSATMLEVLVIHDADLQINVGFDTVDDQPCSAFFMRAIATSRFSP